MNRLDEIAKQKGTDKSSIFHRYTQYYEQIFSNYEYPTILEIGVLDGASIFTYNEYYKGKCEIYCLDIEDKSDLFEGYDNIHFFRLNQGNHDQWNKFLSDYKNIHFDIIVEDGSHLWSHQMITLLTLCDKVAPGGCYILEDLHTSYSQGDSKTESPLFYLNFLEKGSRPQGLSVENQRYLTDRVDDIIIYNLRNRSGFEPKYGRSITAVITFK